MSENTGANQNIELSLPVNAAYLSAARLTVSSVAGRLGFDTDEIEDIKAAVSEACGYIIKKSLKDKPNNFKIIFCMDNDILEIRIKSDVRFLKEIKEEMSLLMIKALMDTLEFSDSNEYIEMKMSKKHKNNLL